MKAPDKVSYADLARVIFDRYTEIRHGRPMRYRYCCEDCMKEADTMAFRLRELHNDINQRVEKQNCWEASRHIPEDKFEKIEAEETNIFKINGTASKTTLRGTGESVAFNYLSGPVFWHEPPKNLIDILENLPGSRPTPDGGLILDADEVRQTLENLGIQYNEDIFKEDDDDDDQPRPAFFRR